MFYHLSRKLSIKVTQVAELQLEEEEEVRFLAEKIFHLIDQNFILTSSVDKK